MRRVVRRYGWKMLLVLSVGVGAISGALALAHMASSHQDWPVQGEDVHVCTPGPWGRLWYAPAIIELPPDRVRVMPTPPPLPRWYLECASTRELQGALEGCGLDDGQVQGLLETYVALTNGPGYTLQPSTNLVVSLKPEVRSKLYALLSRFPQNAGQRDPFRFSGDGSQDWLKGSHLEPAAEELVRSLIYHHGRTPMFSDMAFLLNRYPSAQMQSTLFRVLSREATVVARVRVLPEDDVDALARYWGGRARQDEVLTRLKTMQTTEACCDVPVSSLLPPFARDRLYRYSQQGDPAFASCHYSSMNFLNTQADDRFTNLDEVNKALARDYVEVTDNHFRLGDIILFVTSGGGAIHSCNYVADQIVFTRNGGEMIQPWILTTLDALLDFYSWQEPVHLKVMRRRDLAVG